MADLIALGNDHRGFALKKFLSEKLTSIGYEVMDFGTDGSTPVDYPDYAAPAAHAVSTGLAHRAVVICGSGLGVSYTANRFPGVRAALVHDEPTATLARQHNDSNVLAFSADSQDAEEAWTILRVWLETTFEGGRHQTRVAKVDLMTPAAGGAELDRQDPEIASLLRQEAKRQALNLELIASENFVSEAVLEATGSVATNKYAEGYPGRRYYGGCGVVDQIERLAIERAKALFGTEFANVQPHSGSQANEAVYRATVNVGDTVLAMSLDHGGHLTHGSPVNFSGQLYNVISYGVKRDTEQIDYDEVRRLAKEHRPKLIQCGTTAYSRTLDFNVFREISDEVGALLFADIAHIAGLVATGEHPTPVGKAHIITTTTHKTLRGPRGGLILTNDPVHAKAVDRAVFPGGQGGPLVHVIAGKAVAFREAAHPKFQEYCSKVISNAKALASALSSRDVRIVSGGTDTHLFMISLVGREITGKQAQNSLEKAGITANKNMIPYDPRKPMVTSGVRFGTPAVTTRGMEEAEMNEIANFIAEVLRAPEDSATLEDIKTRVENLCRRFPLYANRWQEMD